MLFLPRATAVNTQDVLMTLEASTVRSRTGIDDEDDDESYETAASTSPVTTSVEHHNMDITDSNPTKELEPEEDNEEPIADNHDNDDGSSINDPPARAILNIVGADKEAAMEDGYDSDGGPPPNNSTAEEEALLEEEVLGETPLAVGDNNIEEDEEAGNETPASPLNVPVAITEDELKKLRVPEIKQQLAIQNVSYSSRLKRPELLERLKQSLHLPVVASVAKAKGTKRNKRRMTRRRRMTCRNLLQVLTGKS
jgi:hypothetical protein